MMSTSRSQLDRVLDPDNVAIQLDTLMKAARAVGKTVEIKIRNAREEGCASVMRSRWVRRVVT